MNMSSNRSHLGRDMIVSAVLTTFIERVAFSRKKSRPRFSKERFASYQGVRSLTGEVLLFVAILAFERFAEMIIHDLISLFGDHTRRPRTKV